jgi:spermidine synthase
VESIDSVEIEPAMPQATRFFEKVNHHILDDPRFHLIPEDGRLYISLTDRHYDAIISEPSNPWIAGVAQLFTREYFEQCRAHLNPGGIVCIWVQGYNTDPQTVRSIAGTYASVFPHVTIWEPISGDYLLVGSASPLQLDYGTFAKRVRAEPIRADLAALGIPEPQDLFTRFVMDETTVREFAGDAPLHTDDRTWLEFNAPRYLLDQLSGMRTKEAVNEFRARGFHFVTAGPAEAAEWSDLKPKIDQALRVEKDHLSADTLYARGLLVEKSNVTQAAGFYRAALALNPNLPEALNNLAWIMATDPDDKLHNAPQAVACAERATKIVEGRNVTILDTLAAAYAAAGRYDEAVAVAGKAIELANLTHDTKSLPDLQHRQALYRAHQAFRSIPTVASVSH